MARSCDSTSSCAAGVPWLNLKRATSMPSSTRRSSTSRLLLDGPIVTATLRRGGTGAVGGWVNLSVGRGTFNGYWFARSDGRGGEQGSR
eukprot:350416-Chlamydomonas_euryale.AAC.2